MANDPKSDQELASSIRSAVDLLHACILEAHNAGLDVEADVLTVTGPRGISRPNFRVKISRQIGN